jgi:transcription-repair coupling factor (superfamily II helicase)
MITAGDARKRIHAIKQYTALGSGFKIAMRDLEIRGAGNLLGTRQSGHIAQIGFELYCQLLRQSVDRLKGRQDAPRGECAFKADFVVTTETAWLRQSEIPNLTSQIPAFLPASWLADTQLRITAYRELSEAGTEKAVDALEQSWRDRHGRLPDAASHLLTIARIKALAARQRIASVEINQQRLMLHRNGDYILLEGRRFPRLKAEKPAAKLAETIVMLRSL